MKKMDIGDDVSFYAVVYSEHTLYHGLVRVDGKVVVKYPKSNIYDIVDYRGRMWKYEERL